MQKNVREMRKIIGIGNALVDVLVRLDDDKRLAELGLPKGSMQLIGEDTFASLRRKLREVHTQTANGGSCSNTMMALARLGAETGFVGKVGDDAYGHLFAGNAMAAGVKAGLAVCDRHTGVASTFISPDGERTFATYLGAAACLGPEDVTTETWRGYDMLYVEGYLVQNHALMESVLRTAKESGLEVCIDLASYNVVAADLPFFRRMVNDYVDIVFANEEESAAFTGGKSPEDALCEMAEACGMAVVKLGRRGAVVRRGNERAGEGALDVPHVVDTTGAGDFFAAGFLYGYVHNCSLSCCLRLGTLLGAAVIRQVGTSLPEKQWDEIRLNVSRIMAG